MKIRPGLLTFVLSVVLVAGFLIGFFFGQRQ